jgi:hypothetical protein
MLEDGLDDVNRILDGTLKRKVEDVRGILVLTV